jgi:hypothetical protein
MRPSVPGTISTKQPNSFGQKVNIELNTLGEGKYQVLTQQLANGSYILELQSTDAIVRKALQIVR